MNIPDNFILNTNSLIIAARDKLKILNISNYEFNDFLTRIINALSYKSVADVQLMDNIMEISDEYAQFLDEDKVLFLSSTLNTLGQQLLTHLSIGGFYMNNETLPYCFTRLIGNDIQIRYEIPFTEEALF